MTSTRRSSLWPRSSAQPTASTPAPAKRQSSRYDGGDDDDDDDDDDDGGDESDDDDVANSAGTLYVL